MYLVEALVRHGVLEQAHRHARVDHDAHGRRRVVIQHQYDVASPSTAQHGMCDEKPTGQWRQNRCRGLTKCKKRESVRMRIHQLAVTVPRCHKLPRQSKCGAYSESAHLWLRIRVAVDAVSGRQRRNAALLGPGCNHVQAAQRKQCRVCCDAVHALSTPTSHKIHDDNP